MMPASSWRRSSEKCDQEIYFLSVFRQYYRSTAVRGKFSSPRGPGKFRGPPIANAAGLGNGRPQRQLGSRLCPVGHVVCAAHRGAAAILRTFQQFGLDFDRCLIFSFSALDHVRCGVTCLTDRAGIPARCAARAVEDAQWPRSSSSLTQTSRLTPVCRFPIGR